MEILKYSIATEEDLPTLNNLYTDMNDKPLMSKSEITSVWHQIQQVPNYHIHIAYLEGKAIGTFSLLFMPTMMHQGFHKSAILDAVTVLSTYRSKGYGKQMMQEALKISAKAGCYKITLSSNMKHDRTHKFYESLGFKQHGWSFNYQLQSNVN